jgi:hypothetical protein
VRNVGGIATPSTLKKLPQIAFGLDRRKNRTAIKFHLGAADFRCDGDRSVAKMVEAGVGLHPELAGRIKLGPLPLRDHH